MNLEYRFERALLTEARAIAGGRARSGEADADFWYLRGALAARSGEMHVAVACLWRALAIDRCNSSSFRELGDALSRIQRCDEAVAACLQAIRLAKLDFTAWRCLGEVLSRTGRFAHTAIAFEEALRIQPENASIHRQLGDAKRALAQTSEALRHYEASVQLAPSDWRSRASLGREWLRRHKWLLAAHHFRAGIRTDARQADLHVGLGRSLAALRHFDEAAAEFHTALRLEPENVEASQSLVLALECQGKMQDAVSAWVHLGRALNAKGYWHKAAEACRQALARKPDCLQALILLGVLHLRMGDARKAISPLKSALAIDSELFAAHVELSRAYHLIGDYERGWEEFGWWHHPHAMQHRSFEHPAWDGSPLDGRVLLLWSRSAAGLGDDIQFLRYAQHAKTRGATVVFECPSILLPVAERMRSVDRVIARGSPLPRFDVHAPLGLIPVMLRKEISPFCAEMPYISADQTLVGGWQRRLYPKPQEMTMGLCWAGAPDRGDAHYRFARLLDFAPLAQLRGLRFISLQLGPQAQEVLTTPSGFRVECFLDESCSIGDTAALIANLDLVVTVDTMIAHLAGALAKPVWTLLPHGGDWRWLRGETTPWYPTMRLFRQAQPGAWSEVISRVKCALEHEHAVVSRPDAFR